MWETVFHETLSRFVNNAVCLAATLFIHSAVVILIGLLGAKLKNKGAAFTSLFLRSCLVAVLLTPITSLIFNSYGVLDIRLPNVSLNLLTKYKSKNDFIGLSSNIEKNKHVHKIPSIVDKQSYKKTIERKNTKGNNEKSEAIQPFQKGIDHNSRIFLNEQQNPIKKPVKHFYDQSVFPEYLFAGLYVVFVITWFCLSLFMLFKMVWAILIIERLRRRSFKAKPSINSICEAVSQTLKISPPVVLQSPLVSLAFIAGIFKPVVFLPCGQKNKMMVSKEVLLHELAHLARKDNIWSLFCQIGGIIIPFQPLLWLLVNQIKLTGDYACDDYVVKYGKNSRSYAILIYNIAQSYEPPVIDVPASFGIYSINTSLPRRIERILDTSRPLNLSLFRREIVTVILIFFTTVFCTGFIGFRKDIKNGVTERNIPLISEINAEHSVTPDSIIDFKNESTDYETRFSIHNSRMIEQPDIHTFPAVKLPVQIEESFNPEKISPRLTRLSFNNHKIIVKEEYATTITTIPDQKTELFSTSNRYEDVYDKIDYEAAGDFLLEDITENPETVFDEHIRMAHVSNYSSNNINDHNYEAPQVLDITIPFGFDNVDTSDPVQKKMGVLYLSLQRNRLYPVWSPDGKWIAFTDRKYGIWVVPAEGGVPTLVYDNYNYNNAFNEFDIVNFKTMCFTPDGKEITFVEYESKEVKEINSYYHRVENIIRKPTIKCINIYTGKIRMIVGNAVYGCWSNDGNYFAYINRLSDSYYTLSYLNMSTGNKKEVCRTYPTSICFSSDGKTLLYTAKNNQNSIHLCSFPDLFRKDTIQLTSVINAVCDCSPDGEWILYSEKTNGVKLKVYNVITGKTIDVFKDYDFQSFHGKFSPDGTKICFNMKENDFNGEKSNIYIYNLSFVTHTSINAKSQEEPCHFLLHDNFPNPFNPSTIITFSLPSTAQTTLSIYNIMGQKVRVLVSEIMTSGEQSVVWDGCDDTGSRVSSGMYMYVLRHGNYMDSKKMTLMK